VRLSFVFSRLLSFPSPPQTLSLPSSQQHNDTSNSTFDDESDDVSSPLPTSHPETRIFTIQADRLPAPFLCLRAHPVPACPFSTYSRSGIHPRRILPSDIRPQAHHRLTERMRAQTWKEDAFPFR